MPRRPPKAWWRGCVKRVDAHGGAIDPRRVCGAVWSRKSGAEKRALTIMAERKRRKKAPKKRRHAVRRSHAPKKHARARRRMHARTAGALKRRTPRQGTAKRSVGMTASSGALRLVEDMSQAGRRRLKLAQKLGLKVR